MPGWDEIFSLVQPVNILERELKGYFKRLKDYTGRNILVYFSSWQQKAPSAVGSFSIDDNDRNGIMATLKGLDKSIGLDLILHTPGGDLAATQSIVEYLYSFFSGNIRMIVPHTAMSAGTMIACSGKEIIMGKHSNLGPIDPQIGGVPANEFIKLLRNAQDEISKNLNLQYWASVLQKYPPTFFGECQNAIDVSKKYVRSWLERNMLADASENDIHQTVTYLANYDYHLRHNTRLHIDELMKQTKLKITSLEKDNKLQELVLSIYHSYVILSGISMFSKIIGNHNMKKFVAVNKSIG